MHMMTNDLAGVGVGDQAHVAHARTGRQVSDVRHPDLIGAAGDHLIRARLEQVGVTPEAMVAMGSLVVSPATRHQ